MLAYDFDYYLPDTCQEAVQIFDTVSKQGLHPFYYGGGTEIISMSRVFNLKPDAVIDIKKIPECQGIGTDGTKLIFGSAVTLSAITEADIFPLLSLTAGRIADHTVRNRLTLGGNLCGSIIYRETLLPLLLADAVLEIASPVGTKTASAAQALSNGKRLQSGELIVRVTVDENAAALPCYHIKKNKSEKIGYPLVTVCALLKDKSLALAASGLCAYPFRFPAIQTDMSCSAADIAAQLVNQIPAPVPDDLEGSAAYRLFAFKKTAEKIIINAKSQRGHINA